jgi:pimeloyl-ACP methyl ester carboxylesterase
MTSGDMGAMGAKVQYQDGYWTSQDGLRLHFRDYPGNASRPAILCIPGLTRNARDFEHVAERLAGEWRVICVDLRGRGESAYAADPASYTPATYLADLEALIASLGLTRFIAFGTSLGGIMTMLLAAAQPGRIAGALINDIGPDIESAGLDRIRATVGRTHSWPTWLHAARGISEIQRGTYPDYGIMDWLAMAKRTCRLTAQGRITPDYDVHIAEPMAAPAPPVAVDLWPLFDALGTAPVTLLRGALSDILSEGTARKMARRLPDVRLVTIARTGHAPALDEPASVRAINALLRKIAG